MKRDKWSKTGGQVQRHGQVRKMDRHKNGTWEKMNNLMNADEKNKRERNTDKSSDEID